MPKTNTKRLETVTVTIDGKKCIVNKKDADKHKKDAPKPKPPAAQQEFKRGSGS